MKKSVVFFVWSFASFRLRRQNKALTSFFFLFFSFPSFVGDLKKQQKLDDFRPFSFFTFLFPMLVFTTIHKDLEDHL